MKIFNLKTMLVLLSTMALMLVACEEDLVDPVVEKPEPVTNVQATSGSSTEIIIRWVASTSEADASFKDYEVVITPGAIAPIYVAKGINTITIPNLVEGEIYTITIKATCTCDNAEPSDGASVTWSPASRFTEAGTGSDIKLYEYTSSFGSGMEFYFVDEDFPEDSGPMIRKTTDGELWDIGLNTKDKFVISSPKLFDWVSLPPVEDRKHVEISSDVIVAESLNDVFDSQALNLAYSSFDEREIDLSLYNKSIVLICRVMQPGEMEFNYAKVFVEYKNGSFLQDQSYVQCKISYQKTAGVKYARTEDVTRNNDNTK